MSKEVGGMVGSRREKGAGSERTEGARRAIGVSADDAAVGSGGPDAATERYKPVQEGDL